MLRHLREAEHWLAHMIEAESLRRINLGLLVFWAAMSVVGMVTPIGNSVKYVTLISHVALIETAFVGWIAARAEVQAKKRRDET